MDKMKCFKAEEGAGFSSLHLYVSFFGEKLHTHPRTCFVYEQRATFRQRNLTLPVNVYVLLFLLYFGDARNLVAFVPKKQVTASGKEKLQDNGLYSSTSFSEV